MRYLSQALVHGLRWLHEAKQDPGVTHEKRVLSALTQVTKAFDRRLEDPFGGGYGDDMMMGGGLFDAETMELFDQCNVDVQEIMSEVLMGAMMGGGIPEEPNTDDGLAGMMSTFNPGDILAGLADEGETDCTPEQEEQFNNAVSTFTSCAGWDSFSLDMEEDEMQKIQDQCDAATEAVSSMGQANVDMDAMNDCLGEVLGDNPVGDLMRDIYHHPDQLCRCMEDFGDAVPTCIVKVSMPDDNDLPEDLQGVLPEGDLKVPLSLLKKATCLMGLACTALDGLCETELASMDNCLPDADAKSFSCLQVMEKCALETEQPVSIVAPPQLTRSELPDTCQRVYTGLGLDTNVLERYNHFNAVCNGGTEDSAPSAEENEVWPSSSSSESDNGEESSSSSGDSSSSDNSSSSSSWDEVQVGAFGTFSSSSSDEEGGSLAWVPIVAVAWVVGGALLYIVLKRRRRSRVGVTTLPSRRNFAQVVSADEFDEPLAFEEAEMA